MTDRKKSRVRSSRGGGAELSTITGLVRDNWKNVREQAGEQAIALTRSLRKHGQTVLDDQKLRAVEEIQHLGAAVRNAADKLHDQKSEALSQYVDTAAQRLDGVARYVEELDLSSVAQELGQLVRRRPALVAGGMFLAGLGIARFIKAGQQAARPQSSRSSRGRTGGRGRAR